MGTGRAALDELRRRATSVPPARFSAEAVAGLPEPAARYLRAAIAEGTPLASAVRLEMRGQLRIGRWLPFRAQQLLAPRHGTVWAATVAGLIRGSDRYVAGEGGMLWKLLGVVPIVRAAGPDVTRSSAERAGAESIWAPTAVAAEPAAAWSAAGADALEVRFGVEDHEVHLHHVLDPTGRLLRSGLRRWGDPDRTGTWGPHPFGVEVTDHRTFGGVTIPGAGRAGWGFGTDGWADGEFFRFEITGYQLVT